MWVLTYTPKADPNDWVNVNYVVKSSGSGASSDTSSARQTLSRKADSTAKDGPWSECLFDLNYYLFFIVGSYHGKQGQSP